MHLRKIAICAFFCIFFSNLFAQAAQGTVRKVGTCGGCTYATISAAVADAVGGDRIEVYPGNYAESVDLNTMSSKGDIALVAVGTVTINPPSGEPGITYDRTDAGDTDFPGDISIEGFDVTSDANAIELNGVTGDITVRNCILDDAIGMGIWTGLVTGNVTISNCTADDVIGNGIWVFLVEGDVTISNCNADNVTGIGIWVSHVTGHTRVTHCSADNAAGLGIWAYSLFGDFVLEDCTADRSNDTGIWVSFIEGNASLVRCTADDGTGVGYGIWVNTVAGDTVIRQCSTNNGHIGIFLDELSSGGRHTVRCSDIAENRECGLLLHNGDFDVEAVSNWWGDASGPSYSGNPGGSGDKICEDSYTGTGTFDPWLDTPFEQTSMCWLVPVPTINPWGLGLILLGMAGTAVWATRRKRMGKVR